MEPRRKHGKENGLQQIAFAYWRDVVHEEEEQNLKEKTETYEIEEGVTVFDVSVLPEVISTTLCGKAAMDTVA